MLPRDKDKGLTAKRLRELFFYDPSTGSFITKARRGNQSAGSSAGTVTRIGYVQISINREFYLAHRLAWLYVHGDWPSDRVDHIDGNRANNRISNLRQASTEINMQNLKGARNTNKLGVLGVHKKDGKFLAQIWHKGRNFVIGRYESIEEAHAAYLGRKREIHEGCTI